MSLSLIHIFSITRDTEFIIPHGNTVLLPWDRILVLTQDDTLHLLTDAWAVSYTHLLHNAHQDGFQYFKKHGFSSLQSGTGALHTFRLGSFSSISYSESLRTKNHNFYIGALSAFSVFICRGKYAILDTGLSHSLALLCIPGVVVFACNGMLTVLDVYKRQGGGCCCLIGEAGAFLGSPVRGAVAADD